MSANASKVGSLTMQLAIEWPSGTGALSSIINRGTGHSCSETSFFTIATSRVSAMPKRSACR